MLDLETSTGGEECPREYLDFIEKNKGKPFTIEDQSEWYLDEESRPFIKEGKWNIGIIRQDDTTGENIEEVITVEDLIKLSQIYN